MGKHKWAVLLVMSLFAPGVARSQHTEANDTEVISPPRVKPASDEKKPRLDETVRVIVERTNAFRKEQGRTSVTVDPHLKKAAEYFAGYMAREDRYGHTADGKRPAERAAEHDYEYCIVLENIAYHYNSAGFATEELAAGFFQGWKNSPGHRRNMLDADVTQTGVAVARSENTGYYYAVQMFGRPRSESIRFRITNQADVTIEYRAGEQAFPLPPGYSRTHTRCRPGVVSFRLPDPEAGRTDRGTTVEPSSGDSFIITRNGNDYHVKKERRRLAAPEKKKSGE